MWVFGYGSLMWDNWENQFQGIKHSKAKLNGYQRNFNKASTRNWGSPQNPCPTLGLEKIDESTCVGCAFEFDDNYQTSIMKELRRREGTTTFQLVELDVELKDGKIVRAITPVNKQNNTYLGNLTVEDRAENARVAVGTDGNCVDYIDKIYRYLKQSDIDDEKVNEMREAIQ